MEITTISVKIDLDIARKARNVVYWNRGMTLTKFVEDALAQAVKGKPEADMPMPKKKTLRSVPRFKQEDEE